MTSVREPADASEPAHAMRRRSRWYNPRIAASIARRDILERMQFDWRISRAAVTSSMILFSLAARVFLHLKRELGILGLMWRTVDTELSTRFAERRLLSLRRKAGPAAVAATMSEMVVQRGDVEVETALRNSMGASRPFEKRLLVLKAPDATGKGVLVIKYTNYFKHFRRIFNLQALSRDFHIVLEPSWIGFYLPEILAFETLAPNPVFVQAWEERDRLFLDSMGTNLKSVPLSPNAWTNPNIFQSHHGSPKTYDAIVVSVWADYKRHFALFRALRDAQEPALRIVCIGEPWPRSMSSIRDEAAHYGVDQQVQFFDSLNHEQLGDLYGRSRIALLLSRKEGPNKAIVEAMFAGTPAFIRNGFNYGTRYPYLNGETGGFFDEATLPQLLLDAHRGRFSGLRPDKWVREHWNPVSSTRVLEQAIFGRVTGTLHVKVNSPDLDYLDPASWGALEPVYRALPTYMRQSA